jgi:hypothetical protein
MNANANANASASLHTRYLYHYLVENGITYLCMTVDDRQRRDPFEFLEDIKQRFQDSFGDRVKTAAAFAMNHEFQQEMQHRMVMGMKSVCRICRPFELMVI